MGVRCWSDIGKLVNGVADIVLADALRCDAYLVWQHRQLGLWPVHTTILVSHSGREDTDTHTHRRRKWQRGWQCKIKGSVESGRGYEMNSCSDAGKQQLRGLAEKDRRSEKEAWQSVRYTIPTSRALSEHPMDILISLRCCRLPVPTCQRLLFSCPPNSRRMREVIVRSDSSCLPVAGSVRCWPPASRCQPLDPGVLRRRMLTG